MLTYVNISNLKNNKVGISLKGIANMVIYSIQEIQSSILNGVFKLSKKEPTIRYKNDIVSIYLHLLKVNSDTSNEVYQKVKKQIADYIKEDLEAYYELCRLEVHILVD